MGMSQQATRCAYVWSSTGEWHRTGCNFTNAFVCQRKWIGGLRREAEKEHPHGNCEYLKLGYKKILKFSEDEGVTKYQRKLFGQLVKLAKKLHCSGFKKHLTKTIQKAKKAKAPKAGTKAAKNAA